jgi:hypothetical protein
MKKSILLFISIGILASSCEINQKEVNPTDNFVKIFNHPNESFSYYVESVYQLNDGYLLLSGLKNAEESLNEFPTTSLIRTNEIGDLMWSVELDWRAPVGNLINIDGRIGFVAMNAGDNAYFIEINTETGDVSASIALNINMPLAAEVVANGNLVVLSYDYVSWSSVVTVYSSELTRLNSEKLPVGEDLVIPIQRHLNKSSTIYPFFIGNWQNESLSGFFVNCLYNYTLGVRFFGSDGSSTGGWIYSHQIENAVSSLIHKEDDSYAITRYFNRKNFLNPTIEVDVTSLQNFNDSTQNPLPELVTDAKVSSMKALFGEAEYMLFASTSNSNSLVIYKYALDNDELLKTVEVGFADKIEVTQIIQDPEDRGIIILAQLHVIGRYQRPVLIKIPAKDFE